MTPSLVRIRKAAVLSKGFVPGTDLEDRVSLIVSGYCKRRCFVKPAQQYTAAGSRYRLDFAWPEHHLALEADGWHHERPETAVKDAERDRWLREHGWIVFRVHDGDENSLLKQVARVCEVVWAVEMCGR